MAAAYGYNRFTKGVVASKVAPNGEKVYATTDGGYAVKNGNTAKMDSDHHWYEVDEEGKFVPNKDGGRTRMDGDLKPTAKKAWDTMFNRGDSDFGGKTTKKTMNGASDISNSHKQNDSANTQHDVAKHNTPPSGESSTGSNPSHANNYSKKNNYSKIFFITQTGATTIADTTAPTATTGAAA